MYMPVSHPSYAELSGNARAVFVKSDVEPEVSRLLDKMSMWLVIACFVLPAALFSLCGFLAWLRMWYLGRRREKKVFEQLEEHVRQRYEAYRRGQVECNGTLRTPSAPAIHALIDPAAKDQRHVMFV